GFDARRGNAGPGQLPAGDFAADGAADVYCRRSGPASGGQRAERAFGVYVDVAAGTGRARGFEWRWCGDGDRTRGVRYPSGVRAFSSDTSFWEFAGKRGWRFHFRAEPRDGIPEREFGAVGG